MWPFTSGQDETSAQPKPNEVRLSDNELARQDYLKRRKEVQDRYRGQFIVPDKPKYDENERDASVAQSTAKSQAQFRGQLSRSNDRIGIDFPTRCALIGGVAGIVGFFVGSADGSTNAALRYRAENAHNIPKSTTAWYLYGKSRNYHSVIGGVKAGFKLAGRYTLWTVMFVAIEDGLDRARGRLFARWNEDERRGQKDFLNSFSAGVALAGIYSRWNNFDRFAAMRLTKTTAKVALPYGICQDLVAWGRGDNPWYIDYLRNRIFKRNNSDAVY